MPGGTEACTVQNEAGQLSIGVIVRNEPDNGPSEKTGTDRAVGILTSNKALSLDYI